MPVINPSRLSEAGLDPCVVTLLTDFGTEDAYVAQMKGQILSICPQIRFVDVTHQVAPQDIEQGAFLLAQAAPYFPENTIHLCVVDPGVGTIRKLLAVEAWIATEAQSEPIRQRFVLPDNGLIDLCLQRSTRWEASYLMNSAFWRSRFSATFHGRDIMGPVAAHWCLGRARSEFGPDCLRPEPLSVSQPVVASNEIRVRVLFIDHFGNVVTNLLASHAKFLSSSHATLVWNGKEVVIRIAQTYGQVPHGEPLLLAGSHGYLELAVACGHAANQLGLTQGQEIRIVSPSAQIFL